MASPTQSFPPNLGAGLAHSRVRCRVPCPQVTEHAPNSLHPVHIPSSTKRKPIQDAILDEKNIYTLLIGITTPK